MHQNIMEFPTLDSYSGHKLKRTGDTKLVDWCSDMIRMYSLTVYLSDFSMDCRTTINHFTAQHLLTIWDLISVNNGSGLEPNQRLRSGSGTTEQPHLLTLGGPNPEPYLSTRGFCPVCLDPSVPISGSAFQVSHLSSHPDMLLIILKY